MTLPKLTLVHQDTANDQADLSHSVEMGEALLDAAHRLDLAIPFGCMSARCGVCRVEVLDGELSAVGALEATTLAAFDCPASVRLACQAEVQGDVTLRPLAGRGPQGES